MNDADLDPLIDRIVDGGMSPAQLREAVALLDAAPEGWRRCVFAFLEAQCWGDSFRESSRPEAIVKPVVFPSVVETPTTRRFRPALAAAAIALAFTTGWMSGARPDRRVEAPITAMQPTTTDVAVESPAKPEQPEMLSPPPPAEIREVARLRLASGSPDGPAADVPILAGPGLDSEWLMRQPMPVSDYDRAALERQGYELDQERQLVAMPLADGRRVVVPVDQVRLRYVGTEPL